MHLDPDLYRIVSKSDGSNNDGSGDDGAADDALLLCQVCQ